ncbi:bone morphogenetic protein 1-like [Stylophora pistillata]|uniref:bone morphogenetic protein 1-like n=1 Tax=Stylophora pistillata TaxID=50429 RepID=UPI000C055DBA|nr:bone morphogenetic protein 1-like [Stylophora pistillata]
MTLGKFILEAFLTLLRKRHRLLFYSFWSVNFKNTSGKMSSIASLMLTTLVFLAAEYQVVEASACPYWVETIYPKDSRNDTIFSPGYPGYYDSENCKWKIVASYGHKVLIYFTELELEDCSSCSCDSVEIYDGTDQYSTRLSKSCGSSLPVPAYSTGRNIFLKFTSDISVTRRGFVAHYRVLNSSSGCPAITPGASAGVIYSPNFPWSFAAHSSCDWRIEAPSGKRVNLKFIRFHLGYYSNCAYGHVEVRDGYYNFLLGKYCGSQIPASVSSSSNSLTVKFRSSYVTYSGFLALYQTGHSFPTNASAMTTYRPVYPTTRSAYYSCSSYSSETAFYLESSSSTTIRSGDGGFWNTRAPYSSCTFKISTKKGYNLELSLDNMSMNSCSSCSCGYLKVRDGSSSSDPLLNEYCGTLSYGTVTSTGNHLFVVFYSHYSANSFRATVRSRYSSSTYRPFYPTTLSAYHSCSSYSSETTFYLESSSSTTIRSGDGGFGNTRAPHSSCTFKISTKKGYNLELSLDKMYTYSCYSCSCGYLKVRDGSSSSDPLLGVYCGTLSYGTVTSTGNHLFVVFYSDYSGNNFRATVSSRRGSSVNVAAIVVPIVVAVVLFSIIFAVVKCTKINRSAGPAGSSRVNDVPLQPLSEAHLFPTIVSSLSSGTQRVDVPPPHPNPATAPDELPPSTDYSQGFTNFAEGGGYVQG